MQLIKKHYFLLCPLICFAVSIIYCTIMLHTPAFQTTDETTFRWNGIPYTQAMNADGITRYVHENDILMLEETPTGTRVTVELFPYPGKTFRVFEDHNYPKVFSESDELLLEGQWGTDKVGRTAVERFFPAGETTAGSIRLTDLRMADAAQYRIVFPLTGTNVIASAQF